MTISFYIYQYEFFNQFYRHNIDSYFVTLLQCICTGKQYFIFFHAFVLNLTLNIYWTNDMKSYYIVFTQWHYTVFTCLSCFVHNHPNIEIISTQTKNEFSICQEEFQLTQKSTQFYWRLQQKKISLLFLITYLGFCDHE